MKYRSGDLVYYVSPFVFTIEKVYIMFAYEDELGMMYIDDIGSYLAERDLWNSLDDAKMDALNKLDKFYQFKKNEICTQRPK